MKAVARPREDEKRQGQRTWTDAQRAEQARKLHTRQIWLKSTGPRTIEGKSASSKNARHANYDQHQAERLEMVNMRAYLRTQKSYIDLLNLFLKQEDSLTLAQHNATIDRLFFLENELIDIERQMFDGMTFYEVSGLDDRLRKQNILPFNRNLSG